MILPCQKFYHLLASISKFPLMKCWFLENQQKLSNHVPCDTFWTCFSKVKRYCCLFLMHTSINNSSLYQHGSNVFPHRRCPPPQFGLQAWRVAFISDIVSPKTLLTPSASLQNSPTHFIVLKFHQTLIEDASQREVGV